MWELFYTFVNWQFVTVSCVYTEPISVSKSGYQPEIYSLKSIPQKNTRVLADAGFFFYMIETLFYYRNKLPIIPQYHPLLPRQLPD